MISTCKDSNPMLRDGVTGDWIGTFIGHKGACWSSRLSPDATLAATASADFTAKIWDPHTGECLHTLSHHHIVKSVAFPMQPSPQCVATGGLEKKLRIFDLTKHTNGVTTSTSPEESPTRTNGVTNGTTSLEGYEVGAGVHTMAIKSVIWNLDYNILTTAAEDRTIRWWDLRSQSPIATYATEKPISSCELNTLQSPGNSDAGILSVAAGNQCIFFDGAKPGQMTKNVTLEYEVASVAANGQSGRFVTGGGSDTWVRVWDWESEQEIEVQKGHHGPIWSTSYSPDGNLYATGSEDGTIKLWKACKDAYGLWRV